ncbi:hypothetical protein [Candidatus Neptunichlamydia sp. REUL1]|nr:hypothetical protein [Candidatus Neptunochlamydia sp. REUL1]
MDSDEENLNAADALDCVKKDYEYTTELEFMISTRANFLTWKDFEY